jgi:hypothetical protein
VPTFILPLKLVTPFGTGLSHVSAQIMLMFSVFVVVIIVMGCREKPLTEKYRNFMNDWNFDGSCMHRSLSVLDLAYSKYLIFVAQFVA